MQLLPGLASSVSLVALLAAAAGAHPLIDDPAHPHFTVSADAVAQSPAAKDKTRMRVFNVLLRPGHEAAADAVEEYFRSFGFRTRFHPYTGSVELRGTYAQAEQAGSFSYVAGRLSRTPYRTAPAPHFPESIAGAILATTFEPGPVMDPQLLLGNNAPSTLPVYRDPVTGDNVAGLGPADYATLYGYDNLYNFRSAQAPAGINGAGQVVDIAACYGWLHHATAGVDDDLTQFQTDFGLSPAPNITSFYPSGPGAYSTSSEALLDLSRVYGTAPGAMIRIWFAPTCTMNEFANLFLDIANDQQSHPAAAMSVSYGLPETMLFDNYGADIFNAMDQALSKITGGANQSVALFAASGDDGDNSASDLVLGLATAGTSDVMYPASDPNVLAVGGTAVFPVSATNVTRQAEVAWSGAALLNYGGSGGGISNLWPIPSWQVCSQTAAGPAGACGPQASRSYKNVPDVASNASLQSAVLMVQQRTLVQTGGTSAAAPTWAATVALRRQYAICCGSGHGQTNPPALFYSPQFYRYWLTSISVGSNGRYNAQPSTAANPMGYSNITGLGVPCLLHFPQPCKNGR
jgi:subtilase family serine protease